MSAKVKEQMARSPANHAYSSLEHMTHKPLCLKELLLKLHSKCVVASHAVIWFVHIRSLDRLLSVQLAWVSG